MLPGWFWSPTRDQALSLWSRSPDSKTLDYQRTNPREYQTVRAHTKETTWIQDPVSPNHQQHPAQDASSKQQNKNTNPVISRQDTTSLSPARQRRNQQTKTQHKSHPIWSSHRPLDQPQEGRNKKEERIQPSSRKEFNFPWSLGKGDLKYNKLKKNNEKAEKYYTNEGTN